MCMKLPLWSHVQKSTEAQSSTSLFGGFPTLGVLFWGSGLRLPMDLQLWAQLITIRGTQMQDEQENDMKSGLR